MIEKKNDKINIQAIDFFNDVFIILLVIIILLLAE